MKTKTLSVIDMLEAANKDSLICETFELPMGQTGEFVVAVLHVPDMFELQKQQKISYAIELSALKRRGLDKEPINEEEWKSSLERIKDKESRKTAKENPPETLADQLANQNAITDCILSMMPGLLKSEEGALLFPTESDQARFRNLLKRNMPLFKIVADKYVDAMDRMVAVGASAKNSKSGTSKTKTSENGDSRNVSQEDTK